MWRESLTRASHDSGCSRRVKDPPHMGLAYSDTAFETVSPPTSQAINTSYRVGAVHAQNSMDRAFSPLFICRHNSWGFAPQNRI